MARPREFQPEDALAGVMDVFWRKGFEGTSMQDIEAATGLNKQSLYRVFGDKRAMYLAALDYYDQTEIAAAADLLAKPGAARKKFQRLFDRLLRQAAPGGDRRGCFLCNASTDQGQLDAETRRFVSAAVARMERNFAGALAVSPPYDTDKRRRSAMASKLLAGYFGMRVLIRAEAPVETMKAAARQMLAEI